MTGISKIRHRSATGFDDDFWNHNEARHRGSTHWQDEFIINNLSLHPLNDETANEKTRFEFISVSQLIECTATVNATLEDELDQAGLIVYHSDSKEWTKFALQRQQSTMGVSITTPSDCLGRFIPFVQEMAAENTCTSTVHFRIYRSKGRLDFWFQPQCSQRGVGTWENFIELKDYTDISGLDKIILACFVSRYTCTSSDESQHNIHAEFDKIRYRYRKS